MEKALVVCTKNAEVFCELLKSCKITQSDIVNTANEARRKCELVQYDLAIISAPLPDDLSNQLPGDLYHDLNIPVILLSHNPFSDLEPIEQNEGIITIQKPVNRLLFCQTVQMVRQTWNAVLQLRQQNERLLQKVDDLKLIDQAKCCLIEKLDFTEQQAHRYIQKQAMDSRCSPRVIAQRILSIYHKEG